VNAWRVCKRKHATRAAVLSGVGAKEVGGRWNRRGEAVVYASQSSSLALLETLIHADFTTLPASLVAVEIRIPDNASVRSVTSSQLPNDWRAIGNERCIEIGSEWYERGDALCLIVPSAVNPLENNILLNAKHRDIHACTLERPVGITYDPRLLELFRLEFPRA